MRCKKLRQQPDSSPLKISLFWRLALHHRRIYVPLSLPMRISNLSRSLLLIIPIFKHQSNLLVSWTAEIFKAPSSFTRAGHSDEPNKEHWERDGLSLRLSRGLTVGYKNLAKLLQVPRFFIGNLGIWSNYCQCSLRNCYGGPFITRRLNVSECLRQTWLYTYVNGIFRRSFF